MVVGITPPLGAGEINSRLLSYGFTQDTDLVVPSRQLAGSSVVVAQGRDACSEGDAEKSPTTVLAHRFCVNTKFFSSLYGMFRVI